MKSWFPARIPLWAIILALLIPILLITDALCYQVALPVEIDLQGGIATLHVGSQTLPLGTVTTPITLEFAPRDPVVHEYQLDGTDSTNNFTLDTSYLDQLASSPYYQFQAWMRDLDGTSHWRDLQVWVDGQLRGVLPWPPNGARVALPTYTTLRLSLQLQRPETPMTLNLIAKDGTTLHITLDRNDRSIAVTRLIPGVGDNLPVAKTFFPLDVAPFAAMVIDSLVRTLLWAVLALWLVLAGEVALALVRRWSLHWGLSSRRGGGGVVRGELAGGEIKGPWVAPGEDTEHAGPTSTIPMPPGATQESPTPNPIEQNTDNHSVTVATGATQGSPPFLTPPPPLRSIMARWQRLTKTLHPIAFVALAASLVFVSWIALVQYHAEPHIFDASAYLFAAKMYAMGHLSVPIPPAADRFPGPFMVQFAGQWFGQYAPGTALTLVPGIWLGVPWLVEPILGTFALLGIGLIAARLYDRRVATLAVILGTLSPFYSYLAASYLSHTIALFYLVWGLWALLRFAQGEAGWNLFLSAILFGTAGLTRDQVTVLFVVIVLPSVLLLSWPRLRRDWSRWIIPGIAFIAVILLFLAITWGFNRALTGSISVTPRQLFFAGDHWGFGPGVGLYGQHTLAAGLVNLDELLTILAIDLFGWPFYLTLAFLALPFLTRRAVGADWLMLAGAAIMTGAYVGYFYHGIYLGPRYLFETLPFLLILTARGILTLAASGLEVGRKIGTWMTTRNPTLHHATSAPAGTFPPQNGEPQQTTQNTNATPQPRVSVITTLLITALLACNLLYYMPRQVVLHHDYTGLSAGYQLDVSAIYHPPLHHAIIITDDYFIYQFVFFPLNDPLLRGDVLYAQASDPSQYTELRTAFPGRTLYWLDISPTGSVQYVALTD